MYKKAHLVSDFRKKNLLGWGSNPRNETKSESLSEKVFVSEIPELSKVYQALEVWFYKKGPSIK